MPGLTANSTLIQQRSEGRNRMSFRTIARVAIISLSSWLAASAQSGKADKYAVSFNDAVTWRQYNERRAQMNDHETIHPIGQSQAEPRTRVRAQAKITVQSSEAKKPYDQTASPALMEIRLSETFTGDIDGESPVRAFRSYATINLPASSACNRSAENCADARAPSCFKVQKSSRTARSRRHGLSFPDRGQAIFPGCAARAAWKASLEKIPTERWNTGSNDVAADALH